MVNQEASTRSQILTILRNANQALSGEKIADSLGISRVAVWKGINTLNAKGYRILSSPAGYQLEVDMGDGLFPWEFGSDEKRFHHWAETDSTMNRAREAALSGADTGTIYVAERQSQGRGTGTKAWESIPGGLFFTLLTRPTMLQAWSHRQVLAAQCACVRALGSLCSSPIRLGWPNDILLADSPSSGKASKAGGILAETLTLGNSLTFMNLGIGLNTGSRPSLERTAAIPAGRKDLLTAFLKEFDALDAESADLVPLWTSYCPDVGHTVRFTDNRSGTLATGHFSGLDQAGWAIISTNDSPGDRHCPPGSITLHDKGSIA